MVLNLLLCGNRANVVEDSIEEAGTVEEEEEVKHRRRDRQHDDLAIARHRTNKSTKSHEQQQQGLTDQERNPHKPFNLWAVARLKAQRPLGEWLGMTIYTFIGVGSNLAAVTSSNEAGTMETQYWAWGSATMIGKYLVPSAPPPLRETTHLTGHLQTRYLHLRRQQRRLPQPGSDNHPHHLPRLPLASRAPVHRHANPRRFLRRAARFRRPPRQHHVPRQRRSHPRLHRRKHVHPTPGSDPRLDSILLRTARQRSPNLHDHGPGRQREFSPRSRNARSDHRPRSDGDQHGPLVPNARPFQSRARPRPSSRRAGRGLSVLDIQRVALVVDLGRVGGADSGGFGRGAGVRLVCVQGRGESGELQRFEVEDQDAEGGEEYPEEGDQVEEGP